MEKHIPTKAEKRLNSATTRALKKFGDAKKSYWDKCYKARMSAWKEYERSIAPFEQTCHREIVRASRAYTRATEKKAKHEE